MKKKVWAMYKGDKFITLGTLDEIAKEQNIKKSTIVFYTSPAYKKRRINSENAIIMIEVED